MIHFIFLLPYAGEIWSGQGLLPDPSVNLTYGVIPNILYILTGPLSVTLFVGVMAVISVFFTIGFLRPVMALFLWYGWICLFDRNNLISNPGIPYVGWLLLCCAVIPRGEPLSLSRSKSGHVWAMSKILYIGAWLLMAVGYTISGIDKYMSPSWRDGSAIFHLLENPLARDWWLRDIMVQLPTAILKLKTWSVLFIEMAFLPLAIWSRSRKWIWLAMIAMHIGILMIVDFADLTLGMLMIHWFTFDGSWFKAKSKQSGIVFFDGVCGICNTMVDFLMTQDKYEVLQYAPLQGVTAQERLPKADLEQISTIIYQTGASLYYKSTAVLFAMASIGGIWKITLILLIVPRFIRDYIYGFVASRRYQWFGKKDVCRMPTPEERSKILL